MNKLRIFSGMLLIIIMCFSSAAAVEGNVTYDGNAGQFVFEPGSTYSPSDLFDNFKGVMPGDTLTQKILVKNDDGNKFNAVIYMRSLGAEEASKQFLSQLKLTVTQDGATQLFEAPADQTAQLTDWVCLGTLLPGGETVLNVTLEVPVTLDGEYMDIASALDWQFKVEEIMAEQQPGGDIDITWIYICLLVLCAMLIFVVLCKKKRQNNTEDRQQGGTI